jgi:hypothetical protein
MNIDIGVFNSKIVVNYKTYHHKMYRLSPVFSTDGLMGGMLSRQNHQIRQQPIFWNDLEGRVDY